ncbi:uncharacterized protein HKW66_Vig0199510 [Vigna angularis]|uniref:S-protein homolog n=2 Tax=Phaseolus angularis TaxID=3914 RepID=A0A8T0KRU6_PHAAN|nr:uncharacterized protein HKW66_Vig0199510 [Vigna angularis]BAT93572.1 hypothetical protein VIGAN_08008400 [Vigna angularis var. angularis]
MSISISIHVFFVVFFAGCLNLQNSIAAIQKNDSSGSIDINIISLSIENDLPSLPKLFFYSDFQQKVEIGNGNRNAYVKLLNMNNHTGVFVWKQCAQFSVIPSMENGHQRIFWSVREDALYHSWDNANWEKKESWGSC